MRYFYDNLEPPVARCMDGALAALDDAGTSLVEIEVPEAVERERIFPAILPAELIASLGRERFAAGRARMDPVVAMRGARGLDLPAEEYIRACWRQKELVRIAIDRMAGLDGWVALAAATALVALFAFALRQSQRVRTT